VYGDYAGHRVAPGKYKARLTYKGNVSEADIDILQDPNLQNVSAADWTAQQGFLEKVANSLTDIHTAVNDMRKVKKQIEHHNSLLKDKTDAKELHNTGIALVKKIDSWESNLVETRQNNFQDVINFPSKLNAQYFDLRFAADVHDPRLTQGVQTRLADLEKEWASHKAAMQALLDTDIKQYNEKYKSQNLPAVLVE
jgi:hypothetical protein